MKYSEEEQALLESIEAGEWESSPLSGAEKENLKKAATSKLKKATKSRVISLRLNEEDFALLQQRSNEAGLPYQTAISALVHQYATGRLNATF